MWRFPCWHAAHMITFAIASPSLQGTPFFHLTSADFSPLSPPRTELKVEWGEIAIKEGGWSCAPFPRGHPDGTSVMCYVTLFFLPPGLWFGGGHFFLL